MKIGTVNTRLAMLAAMAVAGGAMPASARDVVMAPVLHREPVKKPFIPPAERVANTRNPNRKARRRLAHVIARGKTIPPVAPRPALKLLQPRCTHPSVGYGPGKCPNCGCLV